MAANCGTTLRTTAWLILGMLLADIGWARIPHRSRARPNLEKQSTKALKEADAALTAAGAAYGVDDLAALSAALIVIRHNVDTAYICLSETERNPRERPRYFKRAEIQIRKLSRRLDYFQRRIRYEDQLQLESIRDRVQEIDEILVIGLVSGKKGDGHSDVLARN